MRSLAWGLRGMEVWLWAPRAEDPASGQWIGCGRGRTGLWRMGEEWVGRELLKGS